MSCVAASTRNAMLAATEGEVDLPESLVREELRAAGGETSHDWNTHGVNAKLAGPVLRTNGFDIDYFYGETVDELYQVADNRVSMATFKWQSGGTHEVVLLGTYDTGGGDRGFWVLDPGHPAVNGAVGPTPMSMQEMQTLWHPARPVIVVY